jgi:predicted dehydrogenase
MPSDDRDLGLAVIGAGYWGKNVVRNFSRVQGARLVGVADLLERNLDRARAAHPDVDCQPEYRALLDRSDIDAVAVCTGAISHYSIAKDVLLADKDVYVEKPLTLEVAHAEELVQLAASRGRILMVGHLLLYHPCIQWIHSQIGSGEGGDLYYM